MQNTFFGGKKKLLCPGFGGNVVKTLFQQCPITPTPLPPLGYWAPSPYHECKEKHVQVFCSSGALDPCHSGSLEPWSPEPCSY